MPHRSPSIYSYTLIEENEKVVDADVTDVEHGNLLSYDTSIAFGLLKVPAHYWYWQTEVASSTHPLIL